ncbi:metallophosphoesterase family protein [Terrihabitans sp. B22-R8]|uniref:metallophosphoesterase family protein n=1 Tax=Terrihabitans sp. B22-R8 TaxID=3425128 RepID=UPI00403C18DC
MIERLEGDMSPRRTYAMGDIHGRLDLLDRLIAAINDDMRDIDPASCLVVTLGDHIDRGPNSRGVIDRLVEQPFGAPHIALKGNHEEIFQSFLSTPDVAETWRRQGGLEMLHSYGVSTRQMMMGRGYADAADAMAAALTPEQRAFFNDLCDAVLTDDYFFCHAGVRPGVSLDRQDLRDMRWIRDEFLTSGVNFGRIVVHGHTPVPEVEVRPNRINVDTGAFLTGHLSCVVLEEGKIKILAT